MHGFLDGDRPLFATYHAPNGAARNIAYVVCLPLHLDLIQSFRSMRMLAEELASAGFHVLRFDYDGTCESVGSTDRDPDRVAAWLRSVERAVDLMRAIPGVEGVGLVGVRMGATFALETSTRTDIARLILWEPSAGAFYTREMEILDASTRGEGAPPSTDGFVAGGYFLSPATVADLNKLNPEKMEPKGTPDVLLVYRDDRRAPPRLQQHLEKRGSSVTVLQKPGHKEMMMMPQRSYVPTEILSGIREWAVERSKTIEGGAAKLDLKSETIVDGVRWKPLRFGASDYLFGIVTEPEGGPKSGLPSIFLLTGGVTPRTAGNNSYVTLANRLAKKGHTVVRMDVANIGESFTPNGTPGKDRDPYPPSILDDARLGLALAKGDEVWLLGLCSGAYAAFQTMKNEPRIAGAFLLNPERFEIVTTSDSEGEAEQPMGTVDQLEQMNRYWQVMKDPAAWKKLLSGKANVGHIVNVVRARVESKASATKDRILAKLGREAKGLAGDFEKLLARGAKVFLVFSEGDPGHAATLAEIGPRLDDLVKKGLVVKVFPGADHNFHEMSSRALLLDWVDETIAKG